MSIRKISRLQFEWRTGRDHSTNPEINVPRLIFLKGIVTFLVLFFVMLKSTGMLLCFVPT